ncbi:hypothetical protein HJC23_002622 [Cyclotella cryptica]|uniref:Serine hydrolase domain-containing protein n=1 Tax=Cyclotella cryptica TaxID=29204 RepID=A0ABD3PXW0_9STRA|eukprot:CCRYP_010383-RA/>CCRYP_010383-RA protein AED:0.04 eAED:0.03 QI:0/0/0/1/1/1/2/0/239
MGKKVLFFHGWAQNEFVMKSRTKKLEKRLTEAGYECVFLDAPHLLPMTSTILIDGQEVQITNGDRENARAWFLYSDTDYADASMALTEIPMHYVGLETSIAQVHDFLKTETNDECFVLGFSQGATFCHILSILAHAANLSDDTNSTLSVFAKIQKTILVSGFSSMHQNPLAEWTRDAVKKGIQIQSLHIFGEGDTSVPKQFSEDLAACFVNAEIYTHDKGHFIPHNKTLLDRVLEFVES